MMEKKIVIFIDLEGTLTSENELEFKEKDMGKFLEQLSLLEKKGNAKVAINLVSPIPVNSMVRIKNELNKYINDYNKKYKKDLKKVESAACSIDDEYEYTDSAIVPLPNSYNGSSKNFFVTSWHKLLKERYNISNCIYIGNGLNDHDAMLYIRNQAKGIVLCPANSHYSVKDVANYIGESNELLGVTQAMDKYINERYLDDRINLE